MKKTIIIYGSSTGTCQSIAENIASKLGVGDVKGASEISAAQIAEYDNILLGTSTWGVGDLQDDWYDGIEEIKKANLQGKTVALFGCGDSASFPDSFCGAMAELYSAVTAAGATVVGAVDASDYDYSDSAAVEDGKFVGLALDEVNENEKTEKRINAWIEEIKSYL